MRLPFIAAWGVVALAASASADTTTKEITISCDKLTNAVDYFVASTGFSEKFLRACEKRAMLGDACSLMDESGDLDEYGRMVRATDLDLLRNFSNQVASECY